MVFGSGNPWAFSSLLAVPATFLLVLPYAIVVSLALRIYFRQAQDRVKLSIAGLWICTGLSVIGAFSDETVPTLCIPATVGVLVAACVAFKSAVPFGLVLIAIAAGALWVPVLKQVKDLSFLLVVLAIAVIWNVVAGGGPAGLCVALATAARWRVPEVRLPACRFAERRGVPGMRAGRQRNATVRERLRGQTACGR